MTQALTAPNAVSAGTVRRPGSPSWRRLFAVVVLLVVALGLSTLGSTLVHLRIPSPTGAYGVGRTTTLLVDATRPASVTVDVSGTRQVRLVAWYPATAGTGRPGAYVPDLDTIAAGLAASGELSSLQVAGLGLVGDPAHDDADLDVGVDRDGLPTILLSPGNATNVEFYAALAEDLASHGFVVIGIDHPYQVAAVDLGSSVAIFPGDPPIDQAQKVIPAKIDERVADIGFVLDRLESDAGGLAPLVGHLDLSRIGLLGHSNGGIAAAEACADPRVDACANIDGQLAGGPFSANANPMAPAKPFMFLTKETEIHPKLAELFEAGGPDTFRVVIPSATHQAFSDGPTFEPRLLPTANTADAVMTVARGFTLAFFDHEMRGMSRATFGSVTAPVDVQVYVYPLEH